MATTFGDTATDLTGKLYGALAHCNPDPARRPSSDPAPAAPLTPDAVECIDRTLDAVTAFRSYAEFVRSARHGYTPTVYPTDRRRALLVKMLLAAGWPVYTGRTQYPARNHADSPYRV